MDFYKQSLFDWEGGAHLNSELVVEILRTTFFKFYGGCVLDVHSFFWVVGMRSLFERVLFV